jgi:hypothetical protein
MSNFIRTFDGCWLLSKIASSLQNRLKIVAWSLSRPSLSFQKVKAHSNIKGNVKADMLAERGQYEVCNVGRYSAAVLENVSPSVQFQNSPSQHSNSENISAVSTNLDEGNNKHETFIIPNFSWILLRHEIDLVPILLCLLVPPINRLHGFFRLD